MMRCIITALTSFLVWSLFSVSSLAADIEVTSKNIVFVGDISEEEGIKLVQNLEIFRQTILAMVNVKNKPDSKKLRIYGKKHEKELTEFTGLHYIAGVYKLGLDGPIFATITKGGFDTKNFAAQVALHEYGHHVLHGMSRDHYPRWYDEGFANYLSTFRVDKDIIAIGYPNLFHAKDLINERWISPEVVLGATTHYPKGRHINKFYAQSWAYVHFMQNSPEIGKLLPTYLQNLKDGQEAIPAFESAFGMSARDFHNLAREYWNVGDFPVMRFKGSKALLNPKVSVRKLSKTEAKLAYAEGERNFMSKKKAKSLKKAYERLAKDLGPTPDVLIGQGHSEMGLQNFDTALNYATQALEKSPNNIQALSLIADLHYHRFIEPMYKEAKDGIFIPFPTTDEVENIIRHLEAALAVDPLDYTATTHLLAVYGRSEFDISETAASAADTVLQFYLSPNSVREHLDLANVKMRLGHESEGCTFYDLADARIETYKKKSINENFARAELFKQTYPQCAE